MIIYLLRGQMCDTFEKALSFSNLEIYLKSYTYIKWSVSLTVFDG